MQRVAAIEKLISDMQVDPTAIEADLQGLVQDYPAALVRIASLRAANQQYLLFGVVELYPFDIQPPSGWKAGEKPWSVPGHSGWSCGFSACRASIQAALRWYSEAAAGKINIALDRQTPILAAAPALAPEPTWGRFSTAVDAPFCVGWHNAPRIHRLVPMRRPARPVWELGRTEQARRWLQDKLGFDAFAHEEWLCGLALLAPDPVCASFRLFPSARSPTDGETLSIEIVPRRTADRTSDLTTLTAHVAERRIGAWTSIHSLAMSQAGYAEIKFSQPSDQVGWALVCKERGLLRASAPHPWLNQINLDLAMSSGTTTIEVPSGGRRKPPQTYTVSQRTATQSSIVGGPVDDRARSRLLYIIARRRKRERLESAPQHMFGAPSTPTRTPAQVEAKRQEAQKIVADLVARARRRLIFVDPFFGPREMRLFALRNSNEVVPRILSGLPALRTLCGTTQGFQFQQGLQFITHLNSIQAQIGPRAPIVRIMPGGDQPDIHDRYLVIDEEVWHCGPSFNELGERLGVIVRLPNANSIRVMIARVWRQSRPLSEMVPAQPESA